MNIHTIKCNNKEYPQIKVAYNNEYPQIEVVYKVIKNLEIL